VALVLLVGLMIIIGRIKKVQVFALAIFFFLVCYSVAASALSGSLELGAENLVRDAMVLVVGIFIIAASKNERIPLAVACAYVFYILAGFLGTVIVQGIDLSFPPRFLFDYSTNIAESVVVYSHGISVFFGFGAIGSAYIAGQANNKMGVLFWLFVTFFLLVLSILGGARGDTAAAILVVAGYLIYRYKSRYVIISLLGVGITLLLIVYWEFLLDAFLFFQRFSEVAGGDYGMRDQLMLEVFRLLGDDPGFILLGRGIGYFQHYYGYSFGMYPHNVLLESIIVFGVPIIVLVITGALWGAKIYLSSTKHLDLLLLLFAASLIISLKSGYIFGSWLSMSIMMYFCGISLENLLAKTKNISPKRCDTFDARAVSASLQRAQPMREIGDSR
jgi:hypothetical protein